MVNKRINKKTMESRYKDINKFRISVGQLTNKSISSEVRRNPILSTIVLSKLKELKEEIEIDIDNITIDAIKVEDIFGDRESEVSRLFTSEIALYDMPTYIEKYNKYLKGKALEKVFSKEKRKEEMDKYNREINELEETVAELEIIDKELAKEEKRKLEILKLQREEFKEKFKFPLIEEIEESIFIKINSYLNNILKDVEEKILHIERYL